MKIKIISALILIMFIHSCTKEEEPKMDIDAPTMNLIEPSSDSIYLSLTNLPVIVDLIENDQLHSMSVQITRESDSAIVFSKHTHLHYQNFLYETSMLLPEIEGEVEIFSIDLLATDHAGNSNSKRLQVKVSNQ